MNSDYVPAGLLRDVLAKLIDALIAILMVATFVVGFTGGSVYALSMTARSWMRWVLGVNLFLQFSCYMRTGARSIGDTFVGIEVVRDDEKRSWRVVALYRALISSLMFEPRWPPTIFVIFLWACTLWSVATERGEPRNGLSWNLGTRAIIATKQKPM